MLIQKITGCGSTQCLIYFFIVRNQNWSKSSLRLRVKTDYGSCGTTLISWKSVQWRRCLYWLSCFTNVSLENSYSFFQETCCDSSSSSIQRAFRSSQFCKAQSSNNLFKCVTHNQFVETCNWVESLAVTRDIYTVYIPPEVLDHRRSGLFLSFIFPFVCSWPVLWPYGH